MSSFEVAVVRLDDVQAHPNADALDLAVIGGYRAVVKKGEYKTGDGVVYIPEQALVPEGLLRIIGLEGKLAGKDKNRVKAIKLRGELSQGIVVGLDTIMDLIDANKTRYSILFPDQFYEVSPGVQVPCVELGQNLAGFLDITKWEPEIPVQLRGMAHSRPEWFPMFTDVENIKKHKNVLTVEDEVIITEKIHGTNFGAGMHRDDFEMLVSSRRLCLKYDANNLYWRAAIQQDLNEHLRRILDATGAQSAVIFGEVFGPGVQDLTYGVEQGKLQFRAFDIMLDGQYVDAELFLNLVGAEAEPVYDEETQTLTGLIFTSEIPMAPILYRGPFNPEVVATLTDGQDTLSHSHVREGVVIRPVREREERRVGRVILKSISASYLLRAGGTEYN